MNSVDIIRGMLEKKFKGFKFPSLDTLAKKYDFDIIAKNIEWLVVANKLWATQTYIDICTTVNPPKPFRRTMYDEFANYLVEKGSGLERLDRIRRVLDYERAFFSNGQDAFCLYPMVAIISGLSDLKPETQRAVDMLKKCPHKIELAKIYRYAEREMPNYNNAIDLRSMIPYYVEMIKSEMAFYEWISFMRKGEEEGRPISELFIEAGERFCNGKISKK
ncbi:hypothetical protein KY335_02020 [Candidatus Woesearchaeota archaeon]|nr:hypothetical protein [Candidatus Woesearchaeota archaeon]